MSTTVTRSRIAAALAAVDRTDLLDGLHARRLTVFERTGAATDTASALAFQHDDAAELGVFLYAIAALLEDSGIDAVDFAATTLDGVPTLMGRGCREAYWPGVVLDEPTVEEWADQVGQCAECGAHVNGGPECPRHAVAPWARKSSLVAVS